MDTGKLSELRNEAEKSIESAADLKKLEALRVKYLGRKSKLAAFLRGLKNMQADKRQKAGKLANEIKQFINLKIQEKKAEIEEKELSRNIEKESIDLTAPGTKIEHGHLHPLTIVSEEIKDIFISMGFRVIEGPEIESEWYNFEVLNIPSDHPARDMQDTFWLKQKPDDIKNSKKHLLPRTHTSATQVRFMEKHQPPFAIISPGRIFRNEATDATHEMQFTQFEGLMVGKDISVANMKGVIEHFFNRFFKKKLEFKYAARYFPYTEPSIEILIKGKKGSLKGKWLEVAGAGMVHQRVFKNAGYVPREWQGFAFGFGVDRLAMIKYKIDDIRLFYGNDIRFLKQF